MTPTRNINADRLRRELQTLGIRTVARSRAERVNSLEQAGVFEVDTTIPPRPPRIELTDRNCNVTNVFIGNGAGLNEKRNNKLHIANTNICSLIEGDFEDKTVTIDNSLILQSSQIDPDCEGKEGELRREGNNLYMYRCNEGLISGWYPIEFGNIKII